MSSIEEISLRPIFIDWGRQTMGNGNNCGGDCFLLPIIKTSDNGIDYILLDTGLPAASANIYRVWFDILAKFPNSRIIGIVLSHYDNDHFGGFSGLGDDILKDIEFCASGKTYTKKSESNNFHRSTSRILDHAASEFVYARTFGKILLRQWCINENDGDIILTTYQPNQYIKRTHNFILMAIPNGDDDDKDKTQDTSRENLSSLITIYLQNDHHYVFTGDSLLVYVEQFVRLIPKKPATLKLIISFLIQNGKIRDGDDYSNIYKYLFNFGYNQDPPFFLEINYQLKNDCIERIEKDEWYFFQLPHHGSIRNSVCIKKGKWTESGDFIREVLGSTDVVFASSAGTEHHMNPLFYKIIKDDQYLIVSYPSLYKLSDFGTYFEEQHPLSNKKNQSILLNFTDYHYRKYYIFDPSIHPQKRLFHPSSTPIDDKMAFNKIKHIDKSNNNQMVQLDALYPDRDSAPLLNSFSKENDISSIKFENQLPFLSSKFTIEKDIKLGDAIETIETIKQLKTLFKGVLDNLPNLKTKLEDFLNDLTIETFEGTYHGNKETNTYPLLNHSNIDDLKLSLKYKTSSTSNFFSWISLESIQLSIGFEKQVGIIQLSSLIVSGNFKLNKLDMAVSIDLNIGGECIGIGFSILNNLSISEFAKDLKNYNKDIKLNTDMLEGSMGFIENLSSFKPSNFSIYLNKTNSEFAGLEFSINIDSIVIPNTNFKLEESNVTIEHVNGNSSRFSGGFKMTSVDCSYSFFHCNDLIGKLLVSFEKSSYKSILDVRVVLDENKSLVEIMGYFIEDFDKSLNGLQDDLKNFISGLVLAEFQLGIDFNRKIIDSFYIKVKTKDPITIKNTQFSLDTFQLKFNNNVGKKSLSLSSIVIIGSNKIVKLSIRRCKSMDGNKSTWQLESTYQNTDIKTHSIDEIAKLKYNDETSFFNDIKQKFELEQVQLLLDSSNKRSLFFSSIGIIKFAVGYLNGDLNLFFSFHFNLKNFKNEEQSTSLDGKAPHLIGDSTEPLVGIGFIVTDEFDIKFMKTSNLEKDQLLSLFKTEDESWISEYVIKDFNRYLAPNTYLLSFECESSLITSLRKGLPKEKQDNVAKDLIEFIFMKSKSGFKLSARYNCSEDPIVVGDIFCFKEISISVMISNSSILALTVEGSVVNGPDLQGEIKGEINVTGFSIGLKLSVLNWRQPFSIEWLFINEITIGGSMAILPAVALNEIILIGDFDVIPLDLQKQIKNDNIIGNELIIASIKQLNGAHIGGEISFNLLNGDYKIKFHTSNINFTRIVNDMFAHEIQSETLKRIEIYNALIDCEKQKTIVKFECELYARFGDFSLFIRCLFEMGKEIEATGVFSPIDMLNGKIKIGNSTFIGFTNEDIKQVEENIISGLPSSLKESSLGKEGSAFTLMIQKPSVKFAISAAITLVGVSAAVTGELTSTSFFLSFNLEINKKYSLLVGANLQKDSFKFSSSLNWDVNFDIPGIVIGGYEIFGEQNINTKFSGELCVFIDSSGLLISGSLDFTFKQIKISIPSFQLTIGSMNDIFNGIRDYIIKNIANFVLEGLKMIGDFVGKIASAATEAICHVGKQIGKTANEIKDRLLSIGKDVNSIKEAFKSVYNLTSDICDSLLGIKDKVVDAVVDTAKTIAEWASAPFIGLFSGYQSSSSKNRLFSIDGTYIKFGLYLESNEPIQPQREIVEKIKNILYSNSEFKDLISSEINLNIINITNQSILDQNDKLGASIKELLKSNENEELIVECFKNMWDCLEIFVKTICSNEWYSIYNSFWPNFIPKDNNNHIDILNNLVNPLISVISSVGYLYNEIQPLLFCFKSSNKLYKQSPKNFLNTLAELTVLSHMKSSLTFKIGGNGSLVKIGNELYSIFDNRLHLVTKSKMIFSEKVLKEMVSVEDSSNLSIYYGEPIEGIKFVRYLKTYYFLLNGVIREILPSTLPIFNVNYLKRATKIKIENYFIGQPICLNKSYLQGFAKEINYKEDLIKFEIGSIRISSMFRHTVVRIKETGDRIIQISKDLFLRIDHTMNYKDALIGLGKYNLIKPDNHQSFRISLEEIPTPIVSTISNMLNTLYGSSQNRSILTNEDIIKIPLFNQRSTYVFYNHGIIKNDEYYYQNFFRSGDFIFPTGGLTTNKINQTQLSVAEKKELIQSSIFYDTEKVHGDW
ncbi:hypothetical protein ACTA71_002078 [Dictyostelium dimigraforme]